MEENITRLQYEGKEIILLATAHVSKESAELVKQVVAEEKPDSICVELDEGRYQSLENPQAWENTDVVKVIKSKRVGFLLANLALSSYQRKMAEKLGTNVGQEMIQGIACAKETGAELVLADRNIQTTFLRIWRKLGFIEKIKLLTSLFISFDDDDAEITDEDLKEMLKEDMLESVLSDMRKEFPKIGEILISERDQYLAAKIKEAAGPKVVAVLGGAHVPGVREEIYKTQDLEKITEVPKKSPVAKYVGWAIPLLIIGLILYGFLTNLQTGMQQLTSWVLWNGALAALFTAIMLGHPLSILTSFLVAPISSLNPFIACGWFTGLVEAYLRKPTVHDVNQIQTDIFSIKGFFKNRFLRILMVVIMANIGSTIGTFVAGLDIIKSLF